MKPNDIESSVADAPPSETSNPGNHAITLLDLEDLRAVQGGSETTPA